MSGPRFTIEERDHGAADLLKRLLSEGALAVGVIGSAAAEQYEDSPATVVEVAEFHEFGIGVPRRSFLADWVDEKQAEIREIVVKAGQAVVKGKLPSVAVALEQIGTWAKGSIQERIASNGVQPNIDPLGETARKKKSTVTLIDKGQLRSSIDYRVESSVGGGS
jgi:hypothetical protein